jgi:hypothetical protein
MRSNVLLRGTLHALGTRRYVVIIVIHGIAVSAALFPRRVDVLEMEVIRHGISRRNLANLTGRKNLLQHLDGLRRQLFTVGSTEAVGELDVELDVEVTEIVMAVRGHTLVTDDLDIAYASVSGEALFRGQRNQTYQA